MQLRDRTAKPRGRAPIVGALAAAVGVLLLALPGSAVANTCSFSGGVLRYNFTPPPPGSPPPSDDGFPAQGYQFATGFGASIVSFLGECFEVPSTVNNTDRVIVTDSSGGFDQRVGLDAAKGPFAPGATDEGDGTSEIEFEIDLGSPGEPFESLARDTVNYYAPLGNNEIRVGQAAGRTWINTNADREGSRTPDLDVAISGLDRPVTDPLELDGDFVWIHGTGGDERLLGRGGPGFSGPAEVALLLKGRGGDNTLVGGNLADRLQGDAGEDLLKGGPGNDLLDPDRGNDVLKGGPGKDFMDGGAGNDKLVGGPGKDEMIGKGGRDVFKARDGKRDTIDCGPGRDKVFADRKDEVKRNCQKVKWR